MFMAKLNVQRNFMFVCLLFCLALKRSIFWKVARLMSTAMAVLMTRGILSNNSDSSVKISSSLFFFFADVQICCTCMTCAKPPRKASENLTQHALRVPGVIVPSAHSVLHMFGYGVCVHIGHASIHRGTEVGLTGRGCSDDIPHLRSNKHFHQALGV